MEVNLAKRRNLNSYLFLFSGLQILCALFYDYDIASGKKVWQDKIGSKNYPFFKYGALALCLNGLLYHCLSKPLYRGTSGFPVHYFAIPLNVNQFFAILCFFWPLLSNSQKKGFPIFQLLIHPITFILGTSLTIYGWKQINPQKLTISGSFLLSRRRDWGIAGTLFSAAEVVLIFWSAMKCIYDNEKYKVKYGNGQVVYSIAVFLQMIGALGYHVLGLKVSKGTFPCHNLLIKICFGFITTELIGTLLYVPICSIHNQTRIFYYHSLIFSTGMIVSGFGNLYISRKKFNLELEELEMLLSDPYSGVDEQRCK